MLFSGLINELLGAQPPVFRQPRSVRRELGPIFSAAARTPQQPEADDEASQQLSDSERGPCPVRRPQAARPSVRRSTNRTAAFGAAEGQEDLDLGSDEDPAAGVCLIHLTGS